MTRGDFNNPSSIEAAVFADGIRAALKEDPLFFVFKYHLAILRELTVGLDEGIRNELLTESVAIIQEACQGNVRCIKCQNAFHFRHCQNPGSSHEVVHILELTCSRCDDVFTLAEDRERVSYFHPRFYKNSRQLS
ncbi:hypothetical protein [Paenibacillus sp. RC67]|uniref:hypothetical protein n=1 Tax=Paenibacillus sp. RC67 TaxID=3039392 RepID=UPI0024ADA933|nr:hypothetical protein [Paenibacillus sp. RC67]